MAPAQTPLQSPRRATAPSSPRLAHGALAPARAPRARQAVAPKRPDLQVFFPSPTRARFVSATLFADPRGPLARTFFERAFQAPDVVQIEIDGKTRSAEIVFDAPLAKGDARVTDLAGLIARPIPEQFRPARTGATTPTKVGVRTGRLSGFRRYDTMGGLRTPSGRGLARSKAGEPSTSSRAKSGRGAAARDPQVFPTATTRRSQSDI